MYTAKRLGERRTVGGYFYGEDCPCGKQTGAASLTQSCVTAGIDEAVGESAAGTASFTNPVVETCRQSSSVGTGDRTRIREQMVPDGVVAQSKHSMFDRL